MTADEKNSLGLKSIIPILISMLALTIAIGVPIIQNDWEKKSIESELIVIDCHLEIIEKNNSLLSIENIETGEKINILKTNITFVNQANSKYPLKIIDSKIDYKGGSSGQKLPITVHKKTNAIFSSEMDNIEFYTPLLYDGNYPAKLSIWYYDPSIDEIKLFEQEVYEIHLNNISSSPNLRITPYQYYVTVAGLSYNDYEFTIHG